MSTMIEERVIVDEWSRCYSEAWSGIASGPSFAHPAKFSRALVRHIYDHVVEEGWAGPGSTIVDPFGGVALGAWEALQRGMTWVGCELEPRFVMLGQGVDCDGHTCPDCSAAPPEDDGQGSMFAAPERAPHRYHGNIETWEKKRLPGRARLLNGDSRKLSEVIAAGSACVSSPPYAGNVKSDYLMSDRAGGNLETLASEGFDAAITSPPFEDSLDRGVVNKQLRREYARAHGISNAEHVSPIDMESERLQEYGATDGQLGNMKGGFDQSLTSPPYENSMNASAGGIDWAKAGRPDRLKPSSRRHGVEGSEQAKSYGKSEGQVGALSQETFWSASRTILEELYKVLKPGAHACFVTKRFVRGGKIVEFSEQWAALCEAVGFKLIHVHHAMLTETHGAQHTLDGQVDEKTVERKSFFRRLAENRGSPRIDWEDVSCFVKPE